MIYFYVLILSKVAYGLILVNKNLASYLNYSCTTVINSVHANNSTLSQNKSGLKKKEDH